MKPKLPRIAVMGGFLSTAAWSSFAAAQDATTQSTTTVTSSPATVAPAPVVAAPVVPVAPAQVTVQAPPPPVGTTMTTSAPVGEESEKVHEKVYSPNYTLITTGAVILGASYTTSVIVGAASGLNADQHLYVPVAGPWIDLANRGGCPAAGSCDSETANKVLLVVDGVLQAAGAIQILCGLVFPAEKDVTTLKVKSAKLSFTPARIGTGYGASTLIQF